MKYEEALRLIKEEEAGYKTKSGAKIFAFNNEGTIPHFHYKKKWEFDTCIKFLEPRYFCHESYQDGLNNTQKKMLMNDLTIDVWKNLIDEWNEGRSENFVPNSFKRSIPNYRFLPPLNPSTGRLNKEDRM